MLVRGVITVIKGCYKIKKISKLGLPKVILLSTRVHWGTLGYTEVPDEVGKVGGRGGGGEIQAVSRVELDVVVVTSTRENRLAGVNFKGE